ncbi:protein NATD1-like [Thalassophryne amazonica]|uniref:protein NATD1-like n=1 Tax=Thalassophryne amazonica TaxID=390379 RepID=UPI0014708A0E|nr:protein NATD1-like [Thalassophryne amazonica]
MACKLFSRVMFLESNPWMTRTTLSVLSRSCTFTVVHDRQNQRFTATPAGGSSERAALRYRYTAENQVDLTSTYVPELFRGQGIAALLTQAAMDFLAEENLKASVSCWYIQKYIRDHPELHYKDLIILKYKPHGAT